MMSVLEAIEHIQWTIENSPKAYGLNRDALESLTEAISDAEDKYLEDLKDAGNKNNETESGCENQVMAT